MKRNNTSPCDGCQRQIQENRINRRSPPVSGSSGVTLIELMVATILLMIAFLSSTMLFSTPPVFAEARREAAVWKAGCILDLMMNTAKTNPSAFTNSFCIFIETNGAFQMTSTYLTTNMVVSAGFPGIPYELTTITNHPLTNQVFGVTGVLATIKLYEDERSRTESNEYFQASLFLPPREP